MLLPHSGKSTGQVLPTFFTDFSPFREFELPCVATLPMIAPRSSPMALPLDPLPIDAWQRDMEAAAQAICDAGKALLDHHRQVSDTADRNARDWKLGDRLQEERQSLHRIIEANQEILVRLEDLRTDLLSDSGLENVSPEWLSETADLIEDRLQTIERELLSTRHVTLDILLWAQRSGRVDDSPHPQAYRERYAALTQYSPVFKPALQAIRGCLKTRVFV